MSFFYSKTLLFKIRNFFLKKSRSRVAFSKASCIESNLFLTYSSSFERCSVSFKSPKTVPAIESPKPWLPTAPIQLQFCALLFGQPRLGPMVAACIRPYLRLSPFFQSVSNIGNTKCFTTCAASSGVTCFIEIFSPASPVNGAPRVELSEFIQLDVFAAVKYQEVPAVPAVLLCCWYLFRVPCFCVPTLLTRSPF